MGKSKRLKEQKLTEPRKKTDRSKIPHTVAVNGLSGQRLKIAKHWQYLVEKDLIESFQARG